MNKEAWEPKHRCTFIFGYLRETDIVRDTEQIEHTIKICESAKRI